MKRYWGIIGLVAFGLVIYFSNNHLPKKPFRTNLAQHQTPDELWSERLAAKKKQKALGRSKFDQPNEYTKHYRLIREGHGKYKATYTPGYRFMALQKARQEAARKIANARTNAVLWEERGPANVPGRTRSLLILSTDPTGNSWIAGAVGGGIWKTTDAGETWNNLTPDLPNIAVTTLAMSGQVIYAGLISL